MRPLAALFLAVPSLTSAATLEIDYTLTSGGGEIPSFEIPNPNGPDPFTVAPVVNIGSASFTAVFQTDDTGAPKGSAVQITDFTFVGSFDIAISSDITFFGQTTTITANLTGPLEATQSSDSIGSIVRIAGGTTAEQDRFDETSPGAFSTLAGPTSCSDNAFGVACTLIETTGDVTFPLPATTLDGIVIPLTGAVFADTRSPGSSSVDFTAMLTTPTAPGAPATTLPVAFLFEENSRALVVPEPGSMVLTLLGALICFRRRR